MQNGPQAGSGRRLLRPLTAGLALFTVVVSGGPVSALERTDDPVDDAVTFTRDVAPIIQENCQVCHQPGAIGPMTLMTYEEVRAWAPIIRQAVVSQEMPPYHYDLGVGIQELKHDARLSESEIGTIVAWVDAGTPQGDLADMPPPVQWPDAAEFRLAATFGPPDLIIRSTPYTVPADGQDIWWQPVVETGLTEDRCILAIETKPSVPGRPVAHHANSTFEVNGESAGRLSEYALGKLGEVVPEDACRIAPANSQVDWDIHYYPYGTEVPDDVVEIGLWFHPEAYEPEFRQTLSAYLLEGGKGFDIPPHGTLMTQGFHSFDTPVRIDSFQPHGHLRLVGKSLQILRKNGRIEMVSQISNWNPGWHLSHMYEDHAAPLMEPGDLLVITAWYDNSANNRYNPDPDQWVSTGDRTADEMSHAWIAVTHLDQEGYERLLAERETREQLTSDQD